MPTETFVVALGLILLILFMPGIKKAKVGPVELELREQHIHPVSDTPSRLSESYDLSAVFH